IQKSGLALAGHAHGIEASRVQIFGATEVTYLESLPIEIRQANLRSFFALSPCAVVVTERERSLREGSRTGSELLRLADETGTPLLATRDRSSVTIVGLHALLDRRMAARRRVHGVLVDVFEVGILMLGPSGIGKSEVALELVMRGHRLVADDVVECQLVPSPYSGPSADIGAVHGEPAELLRYHLEVRGLGILDVKKLFGVTAVRERKRIDVVVRLVEGDVDQDRLGLERRHYDILGVPIEELAVPVRPGRDMASIMEVAARRRLLEAGGSSATADLVSRVDAAAQPRRGEKGAG
ncbi:MAG: HPr(Ser) kinase/phosphatase, partial [Deltaproteobacteria bacterium]|nr:HPr(Ser) kinase/phosphatase [Deltaproteobacteria bacterium]